MPSSNVVVVEVGVPGPPGAGVSPSEKASYVTLPGNNVFTGTDEFRKDSAAAVVVSKGALTTDRTLVLDTTNKEVELWNGADVRGFSDAGATEKYSIDGATGDIQTDGTLQVDGGSIGGELLWIGFMVDGGGSALTTGVKIRWPIPYNCELVPDPNLLAAWQTVLDQSGSISWDLWSDTYANYPPTNADRISGTLGSQNPRISGAIKNYSPNYTGWTTTLVKGSWLFIAIDSVATATWAALGLHIKKT